MNRRNLFAGFLGLAVTPVVAKATDRFCEVVLPDNKIEYKISDLPVKLVPSPGTHLEAPSWMHVPRGEFKSPSGDPVEVMSSRHADCTKCGSNRHFYHQMDDEFISQCFGCGQTYSITYTTNRNYHWGK